MESCLGEARRGLSRASPGWARLGGKAARGFARHGMSRHGASALSGLGRAHQGAARLGRSQLGRPGIARAPGHGPVRRVEAGRRGSAGYGEEWLGQVRPGWIGMARSRRDGHPSARPSWQRAAWTVYAGRGMAPQLSRGMTRLGLARHGWAVLAWHRVDGFDRPGWAVMARRLAAWHRSAWPCSAGRHGDLGLARRGRARPPRPGPDGSARLGSAWPGRSARQGLPGPGTVHPGPAGETRHVRARQGMAGQPGQGTACLGTARQGRIGVARVGKARLSTVRHGSRRPARPGKARLGVARQSRPGLARPGQAWAARRGSRCCAGHGMGTHR